MSSTRWLVGLLAALAIGEAPFVVMWTRGQVAGSSTTGTVYVDTEPAGAEVWLDGQVRGVTPMRLSIPRGDTIVVLRRAGAMRVVPLTIVPTEVVRLRVDLLKTPEAPEASPVDTDAAVSTPTTAAAVSAGSDAAAPVTVSSVAAQTGSSLAIR